MRSERDGGAAARRRLSAATPPWMIRAFGPHPCGAHFVRPQLRLRRCLRRTEICIPASFHKQTKRGPKAPFCLLAEREGLTRIALGRFSGLRPACAALRRPKRWRVLSNGVLHPSLFPQANKKGPEGPFLFAGGERGIRTLGTVSPYTRFPGEHLKPLSHLSEFCRRSARGIDSSLRSSPLRGALTAFVRLSPCCAGLGSNPRYGITVHSLSRRAP